MELQKAYPSNILSNPPPNGTGGNTSNYQEVKQGGKRKSRKTRKSRKCKK